MIEEWSFKVTETVTKSVVIANEESGVDIVISPELAPRESQAGVLTETEKVLSPQKLNPSWLPRL